MLLLFLTTLQAALAQAPLPDELRPWVPWVLAGHPQLSCPVLEGTAACIWPGALALSINEDGGQMTLSVHVDRDIMVPLPGGEGTWPQQVRVDGDIAVVDDSNGIPSVSLSAGEHRVTATYVWSRPPQDIAVPASIGLIELTIQGTTVDANPKDGRLQLSVGSGFEEEDT